MGRKIAHRAAVAAATASFGGGNQLHGAHFRRTAQGAHVHAGAVGVQHVEVVAQLAHHAGDQVHHERIAVDFSQVRHVAAARGANTGQIVTRQVNQHQVLGEFFVVGAHFQLDAAVEIAIQRAVGATSARTGSGDRVNFNLTAGGVIFQRAFRRGAEQREVVVLHKEHVRAWVTLFQHVVSGQRRRAGQREAAGRHDLENLPGANRLLHLANHGTVLIVGLVHIAGHLLDALHR